MTDREKLIELLVNSPHLDVLYGEEYGDAADHLLANGVVVQKHGRWEIIVDDYDCEMMQCSCCGSEFYDGDNDTVDCLHNYCPNCGAKMDGDT